MVRATKPVKRLNARLISALVLFVAAPSWAAGAGTALAAESERAGLVAAHISSRCNSLRDPVKVLREFKVRLSKSDFAYLSGKLASTKPMPHFRSSGNTVIVTYAGGAYDVVFENLTRGVFSIRGMEFHWNHLESLKANLARLEKIAGGKGSARAGAELVIAASVLGSLPRKLPAVEPAGPRKRDVAMTKSIK